MHRSPSFFPFWWKRFPRSGFLSELPSAPRGAFPEENLCTRRDLCRFGPNFASSWGRQGQSRPDGQDPVDAAGPLDSGPSEAPLGGLGSRLGECRFTLDKLVRAIRRIRPSRQTHSYLKFLHKDAKISDRRASSRIATRTASS